jgi:hypothetical protein
MTPAGSPINRRVRELVADHERRLRRRRVVMLGSALALVSAVALWHVSSRDDGIAPAAAPQREARLAAVRALRADPPLSVAAEESLTLRLFDESPDVAIAAADTLVASIPPDRAESRLAQAASGDFIATLPPSLRDAVATYCAQPGGETLKMVLIRTGTVPPSVAVRLIAFVVLGLESPDAEVRSAAWRALDRMLPAQLDSPELDDSLTAAVARGAFIDRESALTVIVHHKREATLPTVVALLRDDDATVRELAAWTLGEYGGATAAAALRTALSDPDVAVAITAASALARFGERAGVEVLIEAFDRVDELRQGDVLDVLHAVRSSLPRSSWPRRRANAR